MYDFDSLVEEILKNRPELTREKLMERVEEKKKTVGAGYLTNQGALFLLAGELGVPLQQVTSSDLTLKDLYVGANDVTVVARVLGLYPTSIYNKKDGGQGRYKRVVLFDRDRSVRLTLWEERVDDPEKEKIAADTPVRVVSGYVKQGLDGKPNLNLGKRGRLEVINDERIIAKLARLDDVAEKVTKVAEERSLPVLDCVVSSEPRYSEFVRADGSPGSLFQFGVTAQGGKDEHRVVIWSPADQPELRVGQRIRITNLKTRRSSRGEFEIHGDAGSAFLVNQQIARTEMRVCAASPTTNALLVFAANRQKRVEVLETSLDVKSIKQGDVVNVSPDLESGDRLVCRSADSVTVAEDEVFPGLEELATKVRDAKDESSLIMVEVIALSNGIAEDVNLKDGSVVKKGELVVGDDTGEIKVVGWRELSGKMVGIQPGERLRIVPVAPRTNKMGGWVLQVSYFTVVEKIRSH
jgi:ssDNA-binding replication factor A large subunit